MKNAELIASLRSFEADHKPEGWPAIQMRDVSALLDAIEALEAERDSLSHHLNRQKQWKDAMRDRMKALEAEVERLTALYENSTAAHEETVGRAMRAEAQLAAALAQSVKIGAEHREGRLKALEWMAALESRLREIGDLAASCRTGPALREAMAQIETMTDMRHNAELCGGMSATNAVLNGEP